MDKSIRLAVPPYERPTRVSALILTNRSSTDPRRYCSNSTIPIPPRAAPPIASPRAAMEEPPQLQSVISSRRVSTNEAAHMVRSFLSDFGTYLDGGGDDVDDLAPGGDGEAQGEGQLRFAFSDEDQHGPRRDAHDGLISFVEAHLGPGAAGRPRNHRTDPAADAAGEEAGGNPRKRPMVSDAPSTIQTSGTVGGEDDAAAGGGEGAMTPKERRREEKRVKKEEKRRKKERKRAEKAAAKAEKSAIKEREKMEKMAKKEEKRKEKRRRSSGGKEKKAKRIKTE